MKKDLLLDNKKKNQKRSKGILSGNKSGLWLTPAKFRNATPEILTDRCPPLSSPFSMFSFQIHSIGQCFYLPGSVGQCFTADLHLLPKEEQGEGRDNCGIVKVGLEEISNYWIMHIKVPTGCNTTVNYLGRFELKVVDNPGVTELLLVDWRSKCCQVSFFVTVHTNTLLRRSYSNCAISRSFIRKLTVNDSLFGKKKLEQLGHYDRKEW
jgi:hypothetical protein